MVSLAHYVNDVVGRCVCGGGGEGGKNKNVGGTKEWVEGGKEGVGNV